MKNSALLMGIVTWALLTACNGGGDEATAQDTGSVEDESTAMDGEAESVEILSAFFGLDSRIPGFLFGCGLSGPQDGMPIVLDRRIPYPHCLILPCLSCTAPPGQRAQLAAPR